MLYIYIILSLRLWFLPLSQGIKGSGVGGGLLVAKSPKQLHKSLLGARMIVLMIIPGIRKFPDPKLSFD